MREPLKIALVGAGLIGRAHLARIAASADCVCAAICDPSPAAKDLAAAQGCPWFDGPADMLARMTPDGVIIATPNTLHVAGGLACLRAGVPVLVEKPVADSVGAARALVDAQAETGLPVLVGHHRRHNPIVREARALVADGRIGRVVAVNALFLIRKPDDYFDVAWRREPGGGPLLINLIHDIDTLRYVCGDIVAVQAMSANGVRGFPVEDTAAVLLRFVNGALGTATVSDAVPAPWSWELSSGENRAYPRNDGHCCLIAGTQGSLALPRLDLWRYDDVASWWEPLTLTRRAPLEADPLVAQLRHFCAVIRGDEQPVISAADAAKTLAVVEAVAEAARTGATVELGPDPGA